VDRADRNMIELIVEGLISGERYNIEIPGLRYGDRDVALNTEFWAKDRWRYQQANRDCNSQSNRNYNLIDEMWYKQDGRLQIRPDNPNNYRVRWNQNRRIVVQDRNGRNYNTSVVRTAQNIIELRIQGLRYGEQYSINITGVRISGNNVTIGGTFLASNNWRHKK